MLHAYQATPTPLLQQTNEDVLKPASLSCAWAVYGSYAALRKWFAEHCTAIFADSPKLNELRDTLSIADQFPTTIP